MQLVPSDNQSHVAALHKVEITYILIHVSMFVYCGIKPPTYMCHALLQQVSCVLCQPLVSVFEYLATDNKRLNYIHFIYWV